MRKIVLLLAGLAMSTAAMAQVDERPEILVLGTYHMANPGRDVYNMQADDVLAPKRQQEMAQLAVRDEARRSLRLAELRLREGGEHQCARVAATECAADPRHRAGAAVFLTGRLQGGI